MATTAKTPKRIPAIRASATYASLTLAFSHGQTLTIDLAGLSPDITRMATLHGLKQKLVDAAAMSRSPDTGRSATIEDKFAAVKTVYDRLLSGTWNAPAEGGGNAGGLLLRALCQMQPAKSPESLKTWLEGKTEKEKAALRANPRIAAIIATLRDVADVDTDAMLDEIGMSDDDQTDDTPTDDEAPM